MEKAFSCGKTGKWPERRRTGKRANEIECPEKGKGKAPDLKSRARYTGTAVPAPLYRYTGNPNSGRPFSAVSKPILATKSSCCSVFQTLQDWHAFAKLRAQNSQFFALAVRKIQRIFRIVSNCLNIFVENSKFININKCSSNFLRNFVGIAGNDR